MYSIKPIITNPYQTVQSHRSPSSSGFQLPKYNATSGSFDVTGLTVPVLAYDDASVTLVWNKPEHNAGVSDYAVYINGQKAGTARENFAAHADWANTYINAFYRYYQSKQIGMVPIDIHSFKADGLKPDTAYEFRVTALDHDGNEIGTPASLNWRTTPSPACFSITDYGAISSETGYTSYDDEINRMILSNTRAIQTAIDSCTPGGKVIIPKGIWMSGALYLHSDMTLELQEGAVLFGSPNADHYDRNYLLYPYSTDTRSWALINAYSSDEAAPLFNIRITGKGILYGNGWKYGAGDSVFQDGTSPYYQAPLSGDPTDKAYRLKQWAAGTNATVYNPASPESSYGILAADASKKAQENGLSPALAYSTRPNLVVIRGARNVYIEGITAENPAFHTIAVLDSENVAAENVKYITYDANNADGIELGNTQNALVYNSFFDTGDDSVNFATGMGKCAQDSGQKPSSNIWTFNNFIREGHGGAIAAGSHTGAGIYEMLVEDNVINHSNIPFRFKSAPVNGGGAGHVLIRDCAVGEALQLFVMTTIYNDENQTLAVEPADSPAQFHHIDAYRITAHGIAENTFFLVADVDYERPYKTWHTHHDLYFQDIRITGVTEKRDGTAERLTGIERAAFYQVFVDSKNPWNQISCCQDLLFSDTNSSPMAEDAMTLPRWDDKNAFLRARFTADSQLSLDTPGRTALLEWGGASGTGDLGGYLLEVRLASDPGQVIDRTGLIRGNSYPLSGLCEGTEYVCRVVAADAAGNRAEGPECRIFAEKGQELPLRGPADRSVLLEGIGYTWATAVFENAAALDPRIRGYECRVNGAVISRRYCYEIKDFRSSARLKLLAGRMLERVNEIEILAFSDDGQTFSYEKKTVIQEKPYWFQAPVWNSPLTAQWDGNTCLLRWNEPESPCAIYAYRVYADNQPVCRTDGDHFNPVNGCYTTKDTCLRLEGLDTGIAHEFKVEAADAWWKALEGKAPFHWTFSGPACKLEPKR